MVVKFGLSNEALVPRLLRRSEIGLKEVPAQKTGNLGQANVQEKMSKARITLGVQAGDVESSDATRPAFMGLRKQLESRCTGSYSSEITEFAIVLRICGSLWRFEGEGVQKLRVNKKQSYVTADYVIPESRWKCVPFSELKAYLASATVETLQTMSEKLAKSRIAIDTQSLMNDVTSAITAFLDAPPDEAFEGRSPGGG